MFGILLACLVVGGFSTLYLYDDNPIEEACEDIIKETTGIDIDLSPSSPEQKDKDELPPSRE